jgi:hypothetical protein
MKTTLLLLSIIISGFCNAQTKVIAHKSHSGNSHNFSKAYQHNLFDMRSSNFGEFIMPEVKNAKLDSVIFINDTCQIMVTSEVCTNYFGEGAITKKWNSETQSWQEALEVSKDKKSSVWKAGKDTVYNHYLFSHNESLEWIKEKLKKDFHFANSIDSTVFVGYNNKKPYEEVNPFIKVNNKYYIQNQYLNININGVYISDGDCTPEVRWGIEYRKNSRDDWQTVLYSQMQLDCGWSFKKHLDEGLTLNLYSYWKNLDRELTEIPLGEYKLFAEISNTTKRIYSNEFKVK